MTAKRAETLGEQLQEQAARACRTIRRRLLARQDVHQSVHEARKAVRKLRALVALVQDAIGDDGQADRALARLGDSLSSLRDASVVIQAAEALSKRHPDPVWAVIRTNLHTRCEAMVARTLDKDPDFTRRLALLARVEARMARWPWAQLRAKDVERALRRGRRRVDKARREGAASAEQLHRWRRRSRKLRMQLEIVGATPLQVADKAVRAESRKRIRALKKLSDSLGWQQDVTVLRGLVRRMPGLDGRDRALAAIAREMIAS